MSEATVKRDHPEDEGGPNVPKKSKGFGYSLSAKLWVLSKYEYCDGDGVVPKSELLSHFENEKESIEGDGEPVNLNSSSLGCIIHDVWKGKVVCLRSRKRKNGTKGKAVLKNLRRKVSRPSHPDQHGVMNVINIPGWEIRINNQLSLSLIRVENWLLDDQRVVTEIRAASGSGHDTCTFTLHSHGRRVSPGEIGLQFGHMSDLNEKLQVIAEFMSTSHLCQGFKVCEDMTRQLLPNRVALYSLASEPYQQETRAFSEKCQIISPPSSRCHNCSRLKSLEAGKKQKSEARSGDISSYHNDRYTRQQEQRLRKFIGLGKSNTDEC